MKAELKCWKDHFEQVLNRPDNIPAEAIKAEGDVSVNVLHGFLKEIWKMEELLEDWTTGLLITAIIGEELCC